MVYLWEMFSYCSYSKQNKQKEKKFKNLDLGTVPEIFKRKAVYVSTRQVISRAQTGVGLSVPFGELWEADSAKLPLKSPRVLDFSPFPEALNPELVSKVPAQLFKKKKNAA